jgi:arylsulfatase
MKQKPFVYWAAMLYTAFVAVSAQAADKKPNILFIMGDDIGWMQPSCYHRGLMVGETPNIDRIASEGGMFMHKVITETTCIGTLYPVKTK